MIVASTIKGRNMALPSGSSLLDAIPIPDEGDQAGLGGSSSGNVDPDTVGEPLVLEDDFAKLKGLFRRVYGFTIMSCFLNL